MYGVNVDQVPGVALSPEQQAQMDALEGQQRLTSWPYYSKAAFFAPAVTAQPGGPYTYTFARGEEARAFGFALRGTMVPGGFGALDGTATPADTNIIAAGQTNAGQSVLIAGIAIQILSHTLHVERTGYNPVVRPVDADLLGAMNEAVSVSLALNGDENAFRLGLVSMIPGAGGIVGAAGRPLGLAQLGGGEVPGHFPNNGWATRSNHFRCPESLIWRKQSEADGVLNVIFRIERTIELFSGGSPENNFADLAADNDVANVATGTRGYTYPNGMGIEFLVHLIGYVVGNRTRSA